MWKLSVCDDTSKLCNFFWRKQIHGCFVGAIYMTINNLPRAERYRKENIILVGIIPGPKEPKKEQINNYLRHLVDELIELYNGIKMKLHNGQEVNV